MISDYKIYLRTYCVKKNSARKPITTSASVVARRRLQKKIKKKGRVNQCPIERSSSA